jgi:hypothetical protein
MAEGLLSIGRFAGNKEGHVLDLISFLSEGLEKFYLEKSSATLSHEGTTIAKIPKSYFESSLNEMMIKMIRTLYPNGAWLDKTPSVNMILLAPLFRRLWPNSRFIFMKRRAIENLESRIVKFPAAPFLDHCGEWRASMDIWSQLKQDLSGVALEVDQKTLSDEPVLVANTLKQFLVLTEEETLRLEQSFKFQHPERTSVSSSSNKTLAQVGWSEDQREIFLDTCLVMMKSFGYSTDETYFEKERENEGLVLV